MREVIDALRPWHSGLILTYGTGLDTRRVTGVYDTRQSREVLQALAQSCADLLDVPAGLADEGDSSGGKAGSSGEAGPDGSATSVSDDSVIDDAKWE